MSAFPAPPPAGADQAARRVFTGRYMTALAVRGEEAKFHGDIRALSAELFLLAGERVKVAKLREDLRPGPAKQSVSRAIDQLADAMFDVVVQIEARRVKT